MSDTTVLLVDCMGILYRGHFALSRRPLVSPEGVVTSGLHHLVTELLRLLGKHRPSYCAAVFDGVIPSFRTQLYSQYKANRPPMPPELALQADLARKLVPALGIPLIQRDTLEADDLIAGLARQASAKGYQTIILSSDKDLLQLVDDRTSVYRPGRPGSPGRLVTPAGVPEEMGTTAEKIPLLLALAGDSSDNIPGARGIGEKTALKIIEGVASLEELYASVPGMPTSLAAKLLESRGMVELSLELVTLNVPLPSDIVLEDAVRRAVTAEAPALLKSLGMNKVIESLGIPMENIRRDAYGCCSIIPGEDEPLPLEADLPVALDTETDSRNPLLARPVGISLCNSPGRAFYIPLQKGLGSKRRQALAAIMEKNGWTAQNAKFDLHVLRRLGLRPPPPSGDPYLADYLLRPEEPGHGLKAMALHWLGKKMETFEEVTAAGALAELPTERVAEYCCADSSAALELEVFLSEKLESDGRLLDVYRNVELPLVSVLADMEERGVGLDTTALAGTGAELRERLSELSSLGNEQAGRPVNLASPGQVSEVLFNEMGLQSARKTPKGGLSSSMGVLLSLEGSHPFVGTVIEFRELSKLLNTYVESLPRFINPETGLLHTSFNQAVTSTGRLSSADPNLQNIPIRSVRGKRVRRCFIPSAHGNIFISADYSQIELRVLAHLAGEGALREAYRKGLDIHAATARAVFGDLTPETRRKAKEVNFSIIYGISPYGLSGRLGVSRGEAAGIINRYFETYPEVDAFYRNTVDRAEQQGETRTVLGRRRRFPELAGARGQNRKHMERMVVNTTVQGSAADIVKLAMLGVHRRLSADLPRAHLVLSVHDELLVECPPELSDAGERVLREEMEGAFPLEVPLSIETGKGGDWLAAGH
ncbi:MAG: DNA polymerase I [Candidatus Fermentibacteraceae bacterium]